MCTTVADTLPSMCTTVADTLHSGLTNNMFISTASVPAIVSCVDGFTQRRDGEPDCFMAHDGHTTKHSADCFNDGHYIQRARLLHGTRRTTTSTFIELGRGRPLARRPRITPLAVHDRTWHPTFLYRSLSLSLSMTSYLLFLLSLSLSLSYLLLPSMRPSRCFCNAPPRAPPRFGAPMMHRLDSALFCNYSVWPWAATSIRCSYHAPPRLGADP